MSTYDDSYAKGFIKNFWRLAVLVSASALLVAPAIVWWSTGWWYVAVAGIFLFLAVVLYLGFESYLIVGNKRFVILEIFGHPLVFETPGFRLLVPSWFVKMINHGSFGQEEQVKIYDGIDIDFGEAVTCTGEVYIFGKVVNAYNSTYNVDNLYPSVVKVVNSLFGGLMGNFKDFDEANDFKERVNLNHLFSGKTPFENLWVSPNGEPACDYQNNFVWKMIRNLWGFEITHIELVDFNLSAEFQALRTRRLDAKIKVEEEEFKIKEFEAKRKQAEKKKEIELLEKTGMAAGILQLMNEADASTAEAMQHIVNITKWKAIEASSGNLNLFEGDLPRSAVNGAIHGTVSNSMTEGGQS